MYTDTDNAALYEMMSGWDVSDNYFLSVVNAGTDVLDVGCGPGQIPRRARYDGHDGRLAGVDPNPHSLARARALGSGIEWHDGRADQMTFRAEFDLVFMSANAFMCFVEDLPESLAAIRAALRDGGRFVFDTRNPADRAFADIIGDADRNVLREDMGRLRFIDRTALTAALPAAGFQVDTVHGDFRRGPVTDTSRSFVVDAVAV